MEEFPAYYFVIVSRGESDSFFESLLPHNFANVSRGISNPRKKDRLAWHDNASIEEENRRREKRRRKKIGFSRATTVAAHPPPSEIEEKAAKSGGTGEVSTRKAGRSRDRPHNFRIN